MYPTAYPHFPEIIVDEEIRMKHFKFQSWSSKEIIPCFEKLKTTGISYKMDSII
jgi:hypothetical protein